MNIGFRQTINARGHDKWVKNVCWMIRRLAKKWKTRIYTHTHASKLKNFSDGRATFLTGRTGMQNLAVTIEVAKYVSGGRVQR